MNRPTAEKSKPQDLIDDLQEMIDQEPDNYLNKNRWTLCTARDYLKEYFDIFYAPDGTPRISLDELRGLVQAKQDGRAKKQCIHSGFCDMPCSGYDDSCISYRAAAEAAKGEKG